MKILSSILLILPLIIFSGCCLDGEHDAYYEFNSDEKDWQIYKANDTLKFVNQRGELRNYIIESVVRDTTPYAEKFNFDCSKNHVIKISVYAQRLPKTNSTFLLLELMKYPSQFVLSLYWEDLIGDYYIYNKPKNSMIIDSIKYTDIYIIITNNTSPDAEYLQMYYSKSKGVIQFVSMKYEVWTRKF